jgi:hypothetical protein
MQQKDYISQRIECTMKRLSLVFLTLILLGSFHTSCKKDNEPGDWMNINGLRNEEGNIKWFTENITVQFILDGAIITGTNSDGSTMQIAVNRAAPGVYGIAEGEALATFSAIGSLDPIQVFAATQGTVTISVNDPQSRLFQGAFNLVLANQLTDREIRISGSFRKLN